MTAPKTRHHPEPKPRRQIPDSLAGLAAVLAGLPTAKAAVLCWVFTASYVSATHADSIIAYVASIVTREQERQAVALHATALTDDLAMRRQIQAVLSAARVETGAARSGYHEFHNGTDSLDGIPFLFSSEKVESVSPGVQPILSMNQRQPLALIASWIPIFLADKCVVQDFKGASETVQELWRERGIGNAVVCPVFVRRDAEPTGFVTVSWMPGMSSVMSPADTEHTVRQTAAVIADTVHAYLELRDK